MKSWVIIIAISLVVVVLPGWHILGTYGHQRSKRARARATRRARALAPVPEETTERDAPALEGESLWLNLTTEIPDGCFTIETGPNEYVTLWLHREGPDRLVSYLRGPDNTAGYVVFARALPSVVQVYPGYTDILALAAGLTTLFTGGHVEAHERFLRDSADYADRTGNCGRCGHPISNELSVWRGLGPECFNKAGTWRLC